MCFTNTQYKTDSFKATLVESKNKTRAENEQNRAVLFAQNVEISLVKGKVDIYRFICFSGYFLIMDWSIKLFQVVWGYTITEKSSFLSAITLPFWPRKTGFIHRVSSKLIIFTRSIFFTLYNNIYSVIGAVCMWGVGVGITLVCAAYIVYSSQTICPFMR